MSGLEGENQVGYRKEQSVSFRMIPRGSAMSSKFTETKDAEVRSKRVMKLTKEKIANPLNDPY